MLINDLSYIEADVAFFGVFITRLKSVVVMPSNYYQFKEIRDLFSPLPEKYIIDINKAFSRTADGRIDFEGATLSRDYEAVVNSKPHSALGLIECEAGPILNRTSSHTNKLPSKPFFSSIEVREDILADLKRGASLESLAQKKVITEKTIGALSLHKDGGALSPSLVPLKYPFRYELGLMQQMQEETPFFSVMRRGSIGKVFNNERLSMLGALKTSGTSLNALMGKEGKHIAEKSEDFIEAFRSATGAKPDAYAEWAACAFAIEESKVYASSGPKAKGAGVYIFDQKDGDDQAFKTLREAHIQICAYGD